MLPLLFDNQKEPGKMDFVRFKEITETICSDIFLAFFLLFLEKIPLQSHLKLIFHSEIINKFNFYDSEIHVSTPKHLSKMSSIHKIIDKSNKDIKEKVVRTPKSITSAMQENKILDSNQDISFSSSVKDIQLNGMERRKSYFYNSILKNVENNNNKTEQFVLANHLKNEIEEKREETEIEESKINPNENIKINKLVLCLFCGNKFICSEELKSCHNCKNRKFSFDMSGYLFSYNKEKNIWEKCYYGFYRNELFVYTNLKMTELKQIITLFKISLEVPSINDSKELNFFPFAIIYNNYQKILYSESEEERDLWIFKVNSTFEKKNIYTCYKFQEKLGQGSWGIVKKAYHLISKEQVAIKIIEKKKNDEEFESRVWNEIEILKLCQHPNIIKIKDVFDSNNFIYIVLELLKGGELLTYLEKRKGKLSEKRVQSIIHSLATTLFYFKKMGIIHRDIKLQNIMLADENEDSDIKIIDLGLATFQLPSKKLNEPYGSLLYTSPEICQNLCYDYSTDIWSLGICLYILVFQDCPFYENDEEKLKLMIIKKDIEFPQFYSKRISSECKDLLTKMLKKNPSKRILIEEVLTHPWIINHELGLLKLRTLIAPEEKFKVFTMNDPLSPSILTMDLK